MNDFRKLVEAIDKIQETVEEDVCSNCGEDLWGDCKCDDPKPSEKPKVEEGIFGKEERGIGEIGAELAGRSVVRQASDYAVEFAQNPGNYDLYSDEDKQKIWNDIKTVVLKAWDDQQLG